MYGIYIRNLFDLIWSQSRGFGTSEQGGGRKKKKKKTSHYHLPIIIDICRQYGQETRFHVILQYIIYIAICFNRRMDNT